MDKTKLARHVSGNNSAHLQEHYTVHYSLWYVVPNTLPVGDLVMEFLHHQIHCLTPEDGTDMLSRNVGK